MNPDEIKGISIEDEFGGESADEKSDKAAQAGIQNDHAQQQNNETAKKLNVVKIMLHARSFEKAKQILSALEKSEEARLGFCDNPDIYWYKLLLKYQACDEADLITKGPNLEEDEEYILAVDFSKSETQRQHYQAVCEKVMEVCRNKSAEEQAHKEEKTRLRAVREEEEQKRKEEERKRKEEEARQAEADYQTGLSYYNQEKFTEAVKYFKKAAEQGNIGAQNILGICYYQSYGVVQNYKESAKWFRKAAKQGHAYAQGNLGICYECGKGVVQNYAEALKWYKKAAAQEYAGAQAWLGHCYEDGYGVEKNYTEAVQWYKKAAAQGNSYAIDALKRLGIEI